MTEIIEKAQFCDSCNVAFPDAEDDFGIIHGLCKECSYEQRKQRPRNDFPAERMDLDPIETSDLKRIMSLAARLEGRRMAVEFAAANADELVSELLDHAKTNSAHRSLDDTDELLRRAAEVIQNILRAALT